MKDGSTQSLIQLITQIPWNHHQYYNTSIKIQYRLALQLILTAKVTLRFNFQEANFQKFQERWHIHRPLHIGQISRHTVVRHAAKEISAPSCEYIDRKNNNNMIFTNVCATFTKLDYFLLWRCPPPSVAHIPNFDLVVSDVS